MELKKFLRTQNLENRKTFDEAAHFSANNKIVSSVQELSVSLISSKKRDTLDKRGIIGLYWPMKGEPDLLKLAVNSNWIVGLPKIRGTKMDFIRYDVGTDLERSNFGKLMQPKNNKKQAKLRRIGGSAVNLELSLATTLCTRVRSPR